MHYVLSILVMLSTAIAAMFAPGSAAASTGNPPIMFYTGLGQKLCMNAGEEVGGLVLLATCNPTQKGQLLSYRYNNAVVLATNITLSNNPKRCLTVNGDYNNSMITLEVCGPNNDRQNLDVNPNGNIVHRPSGKCLNVYDGDATAGLPIVLWDCSQDKNNIWNATLWPSTPDVDYHHVGFAPVTGTNRLLGQSVKINLYDDAKYHQDWHVIPNPEEEPAVYDASRVTIHDATWSATTCMAETGSAGSEHLVLLPRCGEAPLDTAIFTLVHDTSDGTFQIKSKSGKCVDLLGFQDFEGAPVDVWECNTGRNQSWRFVPLPSN